MLNTNAHASVALSLLRHWSHWEQTSSQILSLHSLRNICLSLGMQRSIFYFQLARFSSSSFQANPLFLFPAPFARMYWTCLMVKYKLDIKASYIKYTNLFTVKPLIMLTMESFTLLRGNFSLNINVNIKLPKGSVKDGNWCHSGF